MGMSGNRIAGFVHADHLIVLVTVSPTLLAFTYCSPALG